MTTTFANPDQTRINVARKIEGLWGVKEGDRVFIAHRRATGKITELLIKQVGEQPSFGKFRVRLDDGQIVEEHPDHLVKSPRQF